MTRSHWWHFLLSLSWALFWREPFFYILISTLESAWPENLSILVFSPSKKHLLGLLLVANVPLNVFLSKHTVVGLKINRGNFCPIFRNPIPSNYKLIYLFHLETDLRKLRANLTPNVKQHPQLFPLLFFLQTIINLRCLPILSQGLWRSCHIQRHIYWSFGLFWTNSKGKSYWPSFGLYQVLSGRSHAFVISYVCRCCWSEYLRIQVSYYSRKINGPFSDLIFLVGIVFKNLFCTMASASPNNLQL